MKAKRAPKGLTSRSKAIWKKIAAEWVLDTSTYLLLETSLEALDRRDEARRLIKEDGIVLISPSGMRRAHPALKIERESTTAFLSAWKAIGFNLEPPQDQGRPTGGRR